MYYLSTKTIIDAFQKLSSVKFVESNTIHEVLILKALGANNLSYIKKDEIKTNGYKPAFQISSLFAPDEKKPAKYDFQNPLRMGFWDGSHPSEPLAKWISVRVKNNVFGGPTTWRAFIQEDKNDGFKFSYDYLDTLRKLMAGSRINLPSLAVWANRFMAFEQPVQMSDLINDFTKNFHITREEINGLFETSIGYPLAFSEEKPNYSSMRHMVGLPTGETEAWFESTAETTKTVETNNLKGRFIMTSSQGVTKDLIKKVLDEYYQAILSGPPGTSKSFTLEQLKKDYADTLHIQFHPQYSYQEFIGGYVVDGQNVEWQRGVFEKFVSEEAMKNPDKKYLVIIDEINRANTSQVFGETIQCLDRGSSVSLRIDKNLKEFSLPKNLYIVGTMNSTDKTIGSLDYALKRRFITIYCPPNPDLLIQLCPSTNGFISLYDFLTKINAKLKSTLKNNEDVIGHAIFLNDAQKDAKGQYVWNFDSFEILFNYKILPVIEDYCNGSQDQIINILGSDLPKRLSGSDFKKALLDFMNE